MARSDRSPTGSCKPIRTKPKSLHIILIVIKVLTLRVSGPVIPFPGPPGPRRRNCGRAGVDRTPTGPVRLWLSHPLNDSQCVGRSDLRAVEGNVRGPEGRWRVRWGLHSDGTKSTTKVPSRDSSTTTTPSGTKTCERRSERWSG